MQQSDKYLNLILRLGILGVIAIFLLAIPLVFIPKVKQMHQYQVRCDEVKNDVKEVGNAELELKNKQRRFHTDSEYVEKVAHEVGYARTNEVIYIITGE